VFSRLGALAAVLAVVAVALAVASGLVALAIARRNARGSLAARQGAVPAKPPPQLPVPHDNQEIIETRAGTHKLVYCSVHASSRAVAHCVHCGTAGCAECIRLGSGGPTCARCAASPHTRTPD
jgi:hypothetical protein